MKKFKTFKELNEAVTHSYGCVMMFFDLPEMKEIHEAIEEDDVYEGDEKGKYGLETECHATVLYGLHDDVTNEDVLEALGDMESKDIKLCKVSAFENDDFDVLKFTVECKSLNEMNKALVELPHTNDYPDYQPHATIGYLNPGKAKDYIKEFKGKEIIVTPSKLVYSKVDGTKDSFKIVDGKIKQ